MKIEEIIKNAVLSVFAELGQSDSEDCGCGNTTQQSVEVPNEEPESATTAPVMMSPHDQELELQKAALGKQSKYISQMLDTQDGVE